MVTQLLASSGRVASKNRGSSSNLGRNSNGSNGNGSFKKMAIVREVDPVSYEIQLESAASSYDGDHGDDDRGDHNNVDNDNGASSVSNDGEESESFGRFHDGVGVGGDHCYHRLRQQEEEEEEQQHRREVGREGGGGAEAVEDNGDGSDDYDEEELIYHVEEEDYASIYSCTSNGSGHRGGGATTPSVGGGGVTSSPKWSLSHERVNKILRSISGAGGGSDCDTSDDGGCGGDDYGDDDDAPMSPIIQRLSSISGAPPLASKRERPKKQDHHRRMKQSKNRPQTPQPSSQKTPARQKPPAAPPEPEPEQPESPISQYRRLLSGDDGDDVGQNDDDEGASASRGNNHRALESGGSMTGTDTTLCYSDDQPSAANANGISGNYNDSTGSSAFAWPTFSSDSTGGGCNSNDGESGNIMDAKGCGGGAAHSPDAGSKKRKKENKKGENPTNLDSRIALEMEAARKAATSVVDGDWTDEAVHQLVLQALQQYLSNDNEENSTATTASAASSLRSPSPPRQSQTPPPPANIQPMEAALTPQHHNPPLSPLSQFYPPLSPQSQLHTDDPERELQLKQQQHEATSTVRHMRTNSLVSMADNSLVDSNDDEEDDTDDDDKLLLLSLATPPGFSSSSREDTFPSSICQQQGETKLAAQHQRQSASATSPRCLLGNSSESVSPRIFPGEDDGDAEDDEEEKKESGKTGDSKVAPVALALTPPTAIVAPGKIPSRASDPLLQARRAHFPKGGHDVAASPLGLNSPTTAPMARAAPAAQNTTSASIGGAVSPLNASLNACISATESDVGSVDGLPMRLRARFEEGRRENVMQSLDGLRVTTKACGTPRIRSRAGTPQEQLLQPQEIIHSKSSGDQSRLPVFRSGGDQSRLPTVAEAAKKNTANSFDEQQYGFFSSWPLQLLFGTENDSIPGTQGSKDDNFYDRKRKDDQDPTSQIKNRWKDEDDSLAILACSNIIHPACGERPYPYCYRVPVRTPMVRPANDLPTPSYADALHGVAVDPRMQGWIQSQFTQCDRPAKDGSYRLGTSRTVLVHEIVRGNWTWCTAWSPDGTRLAVATENHHLAVIETSSSAVWRVRHDRKVKAATRASGVSHALRSIAWGTHFIAVGGTGNAVSILAPIEPYPVLHTIEGTGFVGSLHWKTDSSDLVIGSRLDRATIIRIKAKSGAIDGKQLESEILHTIERKSWVHSVAFSPRGSCLAVGDAAGNLLVYNYLDERNKDVELSLIQSFQLDDAVLEVEWSPDGQWLYAGGEDFRVSVIETRYWEVIHRIKRDRWVQCIAASNGGTHVAVGGVSSEISILEVSKGWDSVMGIELNGLVPLSAKWHPKDQYLAMTGQNNSIVVIETTNARHVKGHHLHSMSGILAIEFSPDGRMAVVGNEAGVITFFVLSGSTFETTYELVLPLNDRVAIQWSVNGQFVVIGCRDSLLVVGRKKSNRSSSKAPPKASGLYVKKVIHDLVDINSVSIDSQCQYVAVSGRSTWILDATSDFTIVREWTGGPIFASEWSPDGRWLAAIGKSKKLTIYDTSEDRVDRWRATFSVSCDYVGRALSWAPLIVGGLLYLAYAGDGKEITIMEIRMQEGTWETVLRIQRQGGINALDWNTDGLLAAAISNGTVSIVDLGYLLSGVAVNEMDYNWQRQALACFTEIRRNRGKNSMRSVRWIPSVPGSDSLLAVGGSDGEVEIVDLTERQRCRGYVKR